MSNQLRAVTLTHVRYHKGDQFGHFLAWISLVPVFISLGGFVSHFLFRRELQESFFGRWLYVKDTSHIPNLLKFEYDNARAARRHSSYKRSE
ncbi:putative phosphatidate phosphatase [Helianthus annuus]|nr:putative phosphatidate phosphatase [Helianthus annuus]